MSEYTIRVDARGDLDLWGSDSELVIWWRWDTRCMVVPSTAKDQYAHLNGKRCTEAQARLILNQIKRELENEKTT